MKHLYILLLSILLSILHCGQPSLTGGGSDVGNGVLYGCIYNEQGTPAAQTQVTVIPATYNAAIDSAIPAEQIDTTDSAGNYEIEVIQNGQYTLEALHLSERTRLQLTKIEISTDTTFIPAGTLQKTSTIKMTLPDSLFTTGGYLYVPGTSIHCELPAQKVASVTIDSIPACVLSVLRYGKSGSVSSIDLDSSIITYAGDTTVLNFALEQSKPLYLNTTASGADITNPVNGFPVLIRLNSSNFDFTEADQAGNDIRFTNSSSVALPFEIENWDAGNQTAAIWVRIDTIKGNNSSQYILMYWGNLPSSNQSVNSTVFDTANGFSGVWHLTPKDSCIARDATSNAFHGKATSVAANDGLIGKAGKFADDASYITMTNTASGKLNFPTNGQYSISAWVNSDSITSNRIILSKGDIQYYLKIHNFNWHFAEYQDAPSSGWDYTNTPYSFGNWVHLYGVRSDTAQFLYVNGICVDSSKTRMGGTELRNESFDVEIGRRTLTDGTSGQYFSGLIDEVRICHTARNNEWIKLSYMNQKEQDALVVFDK